jgi:hypothetical protein
MQAFISEWGDSSGQGIEIQLPLSLQFLMREALLPCSLHQNAIQGKAIASKGS